MEEQHNTIHTLFQKYLEGDYTGTDLETLLIHFKIEDPALLKSLIEQQFTKPIPVEVDQDRVQQLVGKVHKAIISDIQPVAPRRIAHLWRSIAAAVILFFTIGIYWYTRSIDDSDSNTLAQVTTDVAPGGRRATITFSNGQYAELDTTQARLISTDGKYQYPNGEELYSQQVDYATVNTPIGGTFEVILPDGSKAWLNALSSVKYPSRFAEGERVVEITGEVYLEVETDKSKPFIVYSSGQRIEVLGTAFNIRNYDNTSLTTLIHGRIALTNAETRERVVLMPGQQAMLQDAAIKIRNVAATYFIAWRDGIIFNRDASLQETCAELERWYGVMFKFPKGFKNQERAINSINRNEMLSSVLTALQHTYKVQFEIRGKEVIVK